MGKTVDASQFLQVENFVPAPLCQEWMEIMLNLKDEWIEREEGSWTFGNSWYQDIEAGLAHFYYANAMSTNALLSNLPEFKERLVSSAQFLLTPEGTNCSQVRARHENLGPYWCEAGVHIFNGSGRQTTEVGVVHRDFEGLMPYPDMMFDYNTRAYSAVLCVAVPEAGGGLNVWTDRTLASEVFPHTPKTPVRALNYAPGTLTLIDSFLMHQIQAITCSEQKPWRMSAVIHFLYLPQPYPHWEYWF